MSCLSMLALGEPRGMRGVGTGTTGEGERWGVPSRAELEIISN